MPALSKDESVGVVTFGMQKYYHSEITPQYVCRYENDDGERMYSKLSPLLPNGPGSPYLNINCSAPNATAWSANKRKATVSVWFRNKTEIVYSGMPGENEVEFVSNWNGFIYTILTGDVIISGVGLDPTLTYTAKFTWPNGTALFVKAKPDSFYSITFNLKTHADTFEGKQFVKITISSSSGDLPYAGSGGGDLILLEEPPKHFACRSYTLLKDAWRKKSNTNQSQIRCDRNIIKFGWHRFDPSIGGKMPDSCVDRLRCSTHASGWLEGGHPSTVGAEVSRRVCFNWGGSCCNWSTYVKVVNCGSYFVYNFYQFPNACSLVYCSDA